MTLIEMFTFIARKLEFCPHGDQMEYADIILYFLVAFTDILIIFFILDFQFGIDCENE